jgi:hypothetical protein
MLSVFSTRIVHRRVELWMNNHGVHSTNTVTCLIEGYHHGVNEIFALSGMLHSSDWYLVTFRDNRLVPSSRVKQSKKKTDIDHTWWANFIASLVTGCNSKEFFHVKAPEGTCLHSSCQVCERTCCKTLAVVDDNVLGGTPFIHHFKDTSWPQSVKICSKESELKDRYLPLFRNITTKLLLKNTTCQMSWIKSDALIHSVYYSVRWSSMADDTAFIFSEIICLCLCKSARCVSKHSDFHISP